MIRPYILLENNWKYLKDHSYEVAILPWGATEAHNYHLPYGTDVIEATEVGSEACRKAWEKNARVILLPTIPYGVNTGQTDIYLDMNINPTTQLAILRDIATVLNRQGIKKLIILNSHGGNNFKPLVRELGLSFPEMLISFCEWFKALDKSLYFDNPDGDHAEEMETSLIQHLRPEWVLPLQEAGDGQAKKWKVESLNEPWAWAERKWSQVTADTGIGNPALATAEKGKIYFDAVTDKVAQFLIEIAEADLSDMYI